MNQLLAEIYASGRMGGFDGVPESPASQNGIPQAEGQLIYELVKRERPEVTLEVGLAGGLSALWICEALQTVGGTKHIAMDPNQTSDYDRLGLLHIERAGFSGLLEFFEQSSHRVLPRLEADGVVIDVALIDGVHLFDYTFVEFFFINRMLRPGGLLLFDDMWMPAVAKVVRYATTNLGYVEESQLPHASRVRMAGRRLRRLSRRAHSLREAARFTLASDDEALIVESLEHRQQGLAVLRKPTSDDDRDWQHYAAF